MKAFRLLGLICLLSFFSVSANESVNLIKSKEVTVYYFHATGRCATCKAVEAVTQKALKELYGDKVAFTSINREKDKENPLVKKYKINGQTLLVVEGENVVNLTTEAFLNARKKPKKLESKLKLTIDKMLK
ncbi:MAG: thioredoxin family protein [Bacteroidales bacterium]|nr:thioredoxin family protein [Bacteroidales bacterium]